MIRTIGFLGLAASVSGAAGWTAGDMSAGARMFERMHGLVGEWEGTFEWTGGRTGSGKLRAIYSLTGAGSALVEHLLMSGEIPTMSTVYHLDGPDLRMTHFCGARNQPRLKANRIEESPAAADFAFLDVTNTGASNRAHVEAFRIDIADNDHVKLRFTFGGGPPFAGVENIVLHRVR